MSGSASPLFLCRGCRIHFMLRPALLLPAARLAPPDGLLTPRCGPRDLSRKLRPATRRAGAYRDGTCTRWRRAAPVRRSSRTSGCGAGRSPTRHASDAYESAQRAADEDERATAARRGGRVARELDLRALADAERHERRAAHEEARRAIAAGREEGADLGLRPGEE